MDTLIDLADVHVLLVEPSSMQAGIVSQMLQHLGVTTVQHFQMGADVEAILPSLVPQQTVLVISSFYLKDMSGAELVVRLRRQPALEAVPFMLISSENRPQVLDPVRQSGACFILPKPFAEAQLSAALQSVLDYLNPESVFDEIDDVDRLKVLLVDDSGAARRHIRRLLTDVGVQNILEAENGRQAMEMLGDQRVDLVLTDYNMPEMDGKALTEYIRTQSWQSDVPILMLTSEQDMGRLAAVERAGVSAVLDKPFDSQSILQIIATALKDR